MANETTSSLVGSVVNSEWIAPYLREYGRPHVNAIRFFKLIELAGKATDTFSAAQPTTTVASGTVGEDYDVNEASDLSNTSYQLQDVTIATGEYAIMRTVTDKALRKAISDIGLLMQILEDSGRRIFAAVEYDACGLFAGLSTSVSDTGAAADLTDIDSCIFKLRNAGIRSPGGLVAVVGDSQGEDLEADSTSTNSAAAKYAGAADRMMNVQPGENNGLADGALFVYKNVAIHQSGYTHDANGTTDTVGAVFTPEAPGNDGWETFALVQDGGMRVGTQRDESLRAEEVVTSWEVGVGELLDASGCKLVTAAS